MTPLTKKQLDNLKSTTRGIFAWDSDIRGLGVRIKPSGTKTFFVQYRNNLSRTRHLVIGQYEVLPVEIARDLARERLLEVIKGADPSAERKAARSAFTVKELCNCYLLEASSGHLLGRRRRPLKPCTVKHDKACMEKRIVPLIGHHALEGSQVPTPSGFMSTSFWERLSVRERNVEAIQRAVKLKRSALCVSCRHRRGCLCRVTASS